MRAPWRWTAIVALGVVYACADLRINPEFNENPTDFDDPSFALDIMPIIKQTCASSGSCHFGPNAAEGLRLDDDSVAYANLVNVPAINAAMMRIRPLLPESSFAFRVLSESTTVRLGYYRMPLSEYLLPFETREMIRNWIVEGAQNN